MVSVSVTAKSDWSGFFEDRPCPQISPLASYSNYEFRQSTCSQLPVPYGSRQLARLRKLQPSDTVRDVITRYSRYWFSRLSWNSRRYGRQAPWWRRNCPQLGLDIITHLRERCDYYAKKHTLNSTSCHSCWNLSWPLRPNRPQRVWQIKASPTVNSTPTPITYQSTTPSAFRKIEIEAPTTHFVCRSHHLCWARWRSRWQYRSLKRYRKMYDTGVAGSLITLSTVTQSAASQVLLPAIAVPLRPTRCDVPWAPRRITGYLTGTPDRWNDAKKLKKKFVSRQYWWRPLRRKIRPRSRQS